ncbi:MAG: MFS transporter, partial [Alphaproteobacteria bacterium]|nr:MFS transporter [Alphaproteobacteria bacterium]
MTTWTTALKGYTKRQILIFLFLGFSCGLPYNLLGYSLSLWLKDIGVALSVVGLFSLVFLPYSFKFLWAPFVDRFNVPYLSKKLGRKKAWALVFQIGLIVSIFGLAYFSPDKNSWVWSWTYTDNVGEMQTAYIPLQTYILALLTAFFASSQDIVVDALRIDTLSEEELGEGAGTYQFGYRMGLLLSGAGVVALSAYVSWSLAYFLVGCFVLTGFVSIFWVTEKPAQPTNISFKQLVIEPFADFIKRHH